MSFLQFPTFLWDKRTLASAVSDPAYLVKILFFLALLTAFVTLLILVWKVTKDRGSKSREPEAALLA